MLKTYLTYFAFAVVVLAGCKASKEVAETDSDEDTVEVMTEEIVVRPERKEYQESATRTFDLLHTKLEVSFDWVNQYMPGEAWLTLTPYFYSTGTLQLDAKGFDINKVQLIDGNDKLRLEYDYDGEKLTIDLGQAYSRNDTIMVYIDYVAKPNEREAGGSAAITSDKGLYFINPLGKEQGKPRQIWTQGETEASSCWFPTIDKPNERTTQELAMTVDNNFVTLSNGLLTSSENVAGGKRRDVWVMDKPHAPYLFFMGVGEYAIVDDEWKDIEVDYYVEPEYEAYGDDIFGNTPEMIEFYSNLLNVEYPWSKYHQIVGRDYVSGAMENTTSSLFFEFLHQTDREMLDGDYEDIIAHELIHQWFGDLVTCESWANLPLNEAFATYGEYLWIEYKYGLMEADMHWKNDYDTYMAEAQNEKKDLIRFHYSDKEDMFDAHSYSKGGIILHALRNYLGDDAFFRGLEYYLKENAYTDVEAHELRLAFEEVSGEDLNWFFNQWFFDKGHPMLEAEVTYSEMSDSVIINIEQTQDYEEFPLYKLPLAVDIYYGADNVERKQIVVKNWENRFAFALEGKPQLVNIDADRILVGTMEYDKSVAEYVFQYNNAPRYMDKWEALEALKNEQETSKAAWEVYMDALSHDFWGLRRMAVKHVSIDGDGYEAEVLKTLKDLAKDDQEAQVRSEAVYRLDQIDGENLIGFYEGLLTDRSYGVMSAALKSIYNHDEKKGYELARGYSGEFTPNLLGALGTILGAEGDANDFQYFNTMAIESGGFVKYRALTFFGKYLKNQDYDIIEDALPTLKNMGVYSNPWWVRYAAASALNDLIDHHKEAMEEIEEDDSLSELDKKKHQDIIDLVQPVLDEIKEKEESETAQMRYKSFN